MNPIHYYIPAEKLTELSLLLQQLQEKQAGERIWKKDPFLWKNDGTEHAELADRLEWLDLPSKMAPKADELMVLAEQISHDFDRVLVLGMGGSSLAPEVFATIYGSKPGYPRLSIVDSTHPRVLLDLLKEIDLERTLCVVASKSGGTAETASFMYYFYTVLQEMRLDAGEHFIALTDPNTLLERLAGEMKFRHIIHTPPEVGGRFSALTPFGMLPAALIGMDVARFLEEAETMQKACLPETPVQQNPGIYLGSLLGLYAKEGINKVTFLTSPEFSQFPQWVEQLVAESTGKHDKGILPIVDEPYTNISNYANDRIFVALHLQDSTDTRLIQIEKDLVEAGKPVISISCPDLYSLAQEFYRWEMATAAAGIILEQNPFDQPDVQLAKTLANQSLKTYTETRSLPVETPVLSFDGLDFFSEISASSPENLIGQFLEFISPDGYFCIQGFIPYQQEVNLLMDTLRKKILNKYKIATSFGYGPRFLHSTGQYHKGGPNNGLFLQITDTITADVDVPGKGYSFGTLITAQAMGDAHALLNKDRKVLKIRIEGDLVQGLKKIVDLF